MGWSSQGQALLSSTASPPGQIQSPGWEAPSSGTCGSEYLQLVPTVVTLLHEASPAPTPTAPALSM